MNMPAGGDLAQHLCSVDPMDMRHAVRLSGEAQVRYLRTALDSCGFREHLAREGLAVLGGLEGLDSNDWPIMFVQVCRVLGFLLPQSVSDPGCVVKEVTYRGGGLGERTIRYSDSRSGGSFHTDGVPVPGPLPDLLGLLCVRQSLTGGELVYIESARVLGLAIRRMPELVRILSVPFCFDQRRKDDQRAVVLRKIIETSECPGVPQRLVYLRDYVESGHAIDGIRPLAQSEIEAMNVLDTVMNDERLHIEGRLSPGQVAVSDNSRYLHGRHSFTDASGPDRGRLMMRCWIRRVLDE